MDVINSGNEFQGYSIVILDASLFLMQSIDTAITQSLQQCILQGRVYVSPTFFAEQSAYIDLLPAQKREIAQANSASLAHVKMPDRTQSTWEMIRSVSASDRQAVVVTCNRLLIERIILEDSPRINADLYDLSQNQWISHNSYPDIREKIALQGDTLARIDPGEHPIGYGTRLYCSTTEEVTLTKLGESRLSGTESELFGAVSNQGQQLRIAKVFRPGNLTPEKCGHLWDLTEAAKTVYAPWCYFPTDVLYRDERRMRMTGIIEDYAKDSQTLYDRHRYERDLSSKLSDNLRICRNLVRQVCYLNHYGFLVSDYNLKNFALRDSDPDSVLMFDTDSFGYKNYFSGFQAAGTSTANNYDTKIKKEAFNFCDDSLYVAVFTILSLGNPPIYANENERLFRYDENVEDKYVRNFFPPRLWSLFEDSFRNRNEFSPAMLLLKLNESLERLEQHPEEDFVYETVLPKLDHEPRESPLWKALRQLWNSGLDRFLLTLTGISILIVLYLIFSGGFFDGLL